MASVLFREKVQLKSPSRTGAINTEAPGTLTSYKVNNMDFNIELAQELLDSPDEFPVALERAWTWLGYSRKDKAVDTLKSYFEEGVDFLYTYSKVSNGGRPCHNYFLTVSCLKSFALLCKNKNSSYILNCFNECGDYHINVLVKSRLEIDFKDLLFSLLAWKTIILTQHFCTFDSKRYYIDFYLPDYRLAIEYDEKYHNGKVIKDKSRERVVSTILNCKFIRVKEGKELEAISQIAQFVFH